MTILRRMQTPITASVADSLHQILVKNGAMVRFRFRFHNGRKVAQISPSTYKNGDQLLKQLTTIITQENLVVDMVEK